MCCDALIGKAMAQFSDMWHVDTICIKIMPRYSIPSCDDIVYLYVELYNKK